MIILEEICPTAATGDQCSSVLRRGHLDQNIAVGKRNILCYLTPRNQISHFELLQNQKATFSNNSIASVTFGIFKSNSSGNHDSTSYNQDLHTL